MKKVIFVSMVLLILSIGTYYFINKFNTCADYDCIIQSVENEFDIEGKIDIPVNMFFQSVHGATKVEIKFDEDMITYQTTLIPNNISEKKAKKKIQEAIKKLTKNDPTDQEIMKGLSKSIETLNQTVGYMQVCNFPSSDKQKFIGLLKKWKDGSMSTNDLDFADCSSSQDSSIKAIKNVYKEKLLKKENKESKLQKEKYASVFDKTAVDFVNFKNEYNIGEQIDGTLNITNIPDGFMAVYVLEGDGEGRFEKYKKGNKIYFLNSNGENNQYLDTKGKYTLKVNFYKTDLIGNDDSLFFHKEKLSNKNNIYKTFSHTITIVDNPTKSFVKGKEVDSSYKALGDDLFTKNNKIYYLDKKSKFVELKGVKKGDYKVFGTFGDIIYTSEKLFFESFGKYTPINFASDYETFEHIQGDYYQDKNNVYYINDLYEKVTTLPQGNITKIEGCFKSFLLVDKTLYKAGISGGHSCNDIMEKYSNFELKEI